jgi:hypothetical protein
LLHPKIENLRVGAEEKGTDGNRPENIVARAAGLGCYIQLISIRIEYVEIDAVESGGAANARDLAGNSACALKNKIHSRSLSSRNGNRLG